MSSITLPAVAANTLVLHHVDKLSHMPSILQCRSALQLTIVIEIEESSYLEPR